MSRGRRRRPRSAGARSPPSEPGPPAYPIVVVTLDDVRRFALTLPRTTEGLVAARVKFRVGRIVYLTFSRDETVMGFAFPKEERDWLVGGTQDRVRQPSRSNPRFQRVR